MTSSSIGSSAIHTSAAAIQQQLQAFQSAASRISDPQTVADAGDIIAMQQAELAMRVNAAVIGKASEMSGHLIDILA